MCSTPKGVIAWLAAMIQPPVVTTLELTSVYPLRLGARSRSSRCRRLPTTTRAAPVRLPAAELSARDFAPPIFAAFSTTRLGPSAEEYLTSKWASFQLATGVSFARAAT